MKTFILHADQEVTLRSRAGYWPVETLRSKPTLSVQANSLDEAKKKAEKEIRAKYEQNPDIQVIGLHLGIALHREISA